jgi:hypothetical protein
VGRPLADIDSEGVRKLAALGCTVEEIGNFYGVDRRTVSGRFQREIELGRSQGNISLRRLQYKRAKAGSDAILIHLGKHQLGQNDKNPSTESTDQPTATDADGNPTEP